MSVLASLSPSAHKMRTSSHKGSENKNRFALATTCLLIDIILIAIGVAGLGLFVQLHPALMEIARWFGVIFLAWYGSKSFKASLKPAAFSEDTLHQTPSTLSAILTVLALTLPNPHVYLDTVVLLGAIGAQQPPGTHVSFALGAMAASLVWFYCLAFGASLLAPLFKKAFTWRILDIIVGCVMWSIAVSLLLAF